MVQKYSYKLSGGFSLAADYSYIYHVRQGLGLIAKIDIFFENTIIKGNNSVIL